MKTRLRRRGVVLVLLGPLAVGVTGCAAAGSTPNAGHRTDVPRPDLCKLIGRRNVAAALHGKVTGCEQAGVGGGYTATFSGRARLAGRVRPAAVVVSYTPRYDPRSRADRWLTVGRTSETAVPMIGVGENAVFDPVATGKPQLVAVAEDVLLSIEVRITGAAVPQRNLPQQMMDIGRDAVTALG